MNMAYLAVLVGIITLSLLSYGCISAWPQANGTPGSPPANGTNLPVITNSTPVGPGGTPPDSNSSNPPIIPNPQPNATNASNQSEPTNATGLTKEMCEQARGHWNDCGSACRGAPPGTVCITVCVAYCECGGIAGFGCPDGYECSDYLPTDKNGNPVPDAMGVCKKKTK